MTPFAMDGDLILKHRWFLGSGRGTQVRGRALLGGLIGRN